MIYGIQEYDCPTLKGKAESWYCSENREECKKAKVACAVIQSEKDYHEKDLIITNFFKFLLASSSGNYGIIVLDDSHSFENSIEQAYQLSVRASEGTYLYDEANVSTDVKEFVGDFLNIFAQVFERCLIPGQTDGVVGQEYVTGLAALAFAHDMKKLKQEIGSMAPGKDRTICGNVYYFVMRCTKASRFQFYVRSDFYEPNEWLESEIISRKEDIGYIMKKRFNKSCLILATATPGDANKHAYSCSLRDYSECDIKITPAKTAVFPEIDNWFEGLSLLVVTDLGDTRQSTPFSKALDLTTAILTNRQERTLVLFKNYRDQTKANAYLNGLFSKGKLFFIDSSIQDSDFVEELASKSQVSLASASSTLWEGINILDLRIAVIVTAPFIRPVVGKKLTYPDLERRMLVRLQQGIGRIIRRPTDYGVAVLMDSRFEKYVKKKHFDKRLLKSTQFIQSKDVLAKVEEALARGVEN